MSDGIEPMRLDHMYEYVRPRRKQLGWTIQELSVRSKVSAPTISYAERGLSTIYTVQKLLEAMGVVIMVHLDRSDHAPE